MRSEILARVYDEEPGLLLRIPESDLLTMEGSREIASTLGIVIDRLESFLRVDLDSLRTAPPESPKPTDEDIRATIDDLQLKKTASMEAAVGVRFAESRFESAAAAGEDMAVLAALVIPMLSDQCPVCGQGIDAQHVEDELRERAKNTASMLELRAAVDHAHREVAQAEVAFSLAQAASAASSELVQRWSSYEAAQAHRREAYELLLQSPAVVSFRDIPVESLSNSGPQSLEKLKSIRSRIMEMLNTLERGPDQGALQRASSEVSSLEELLVVRETRLQDESQRATLLKNLSDGAIKSRVEVTQQRFSAVQPLVANIFSRLDPHPAFKTIEFELDTYYRRGTTSPMVRDLVEGIAADPLVIFSTSQANIAALSYFLAMGISAGAQGLPFVLLDDPVQSMDDVNVLGFADLCRHLRRNRQLIISTHDRRFAGLLERKLAPRFGGEHTSLIEFVGWDRSGPSVEQRALDSQVFENPIRVVRMAS